jgi:DNA-binding IclR family transcriptional regulator
VLRALEAASLATTSAPQAAQAIGIHERTARRLLGTLAEEQYVTLIPTRRGRLYGPSLRPLALAAQVAARLPLVQHGRLVTASLHDALALSAILAVPSYGEILVVAAAGDARRSWTLLPADQHAAGRLLLAYREPWRRSHADPLLSEHDAAAVRAKGMCVVADGQTSSIAVPVPDPLAAPIAALALEGRGPDISHRLPALAGPLIVAAAALAAQLQDRH